ncbi:MAG: DUF255 domain-containing protein, partial [Bacteroidales bacterium]|nr:DUF255 domain-containing protein [Bacteroidales bacterium]
MKHSISLLALTLMFCGLSQAQQPVQNGIAWMSFEEALQENALRAQAGLTPKKVYIDVYTDWCGWCKRLDATSFANPEIIAYVNSMFLPVKLNAERTDTVRVNDQVFVNPGAGPGRRGTH